MEKPKYVLKLDEAVLRSKKQSGAFQVMKFTTLFLILGMIVVSLFIRKNLFFQFPMALRILILVWVVVIVAMLFRKEDTHSPLELQFYNNQLVVYRPQKYYTAQKSRREVNTIKYTEITDCVYKRKTQRVEIYGSVNATWYQFYQNGKMAKTPTSERYVKDTITYFRTNYVSDIDFKQEIESHSPIKVRVEEN